MSLLDRAFVKAYTRSHSSTSATSNISAPHLNVESAVPNHSHGASGLPVQIPDAVAWVEMADESYFRVDVGHTRTLRRDTSSRVPVPPMPDAESTNGAPNTTIATDARIASSPSRDLLSSHLQSRPTNPTVISHTLTAYDLQPELAESTRANSQPAVREAQVEQARMRIDETHLQRQWAPPKLEEPQEYFRVARDQQQADEFARAKIEALAKEASIQSKPTVAPMVPAVAAVSQVPAVSAMPAVRSFEPAWEVDAYEYPETIVELFGDAKLMKSIGVPLDHAVANGLRAVLVTSVERGVGRTSVAVGIAVSAAAAGLRVALVDADTLTAGLAETLRLDFESGWLEAIRGNVPLEEVAIRSIEDQFVVVPSMERSTSPRNISREFDQMISRLRESFELIIIDGAPWETTAVALQRTTCIDAAIVVVDARNRNDARLAEIQDELRRVGVAGLGIVENFA